MPPTSHAPESGTVETNNPLASGIDSGVDAGGAAIPSSSSSENLVLDQQVTGSEIVSTEVPHSIGFTTMESFDFDVETGRATDQPQRNTRKVAAYSIGLLVALVVVGIVVDAVFAADGEPASGSTGQSPASLLGAITLAPPTPGPSTPTSLPSIPPGPPAATPPSTPLPIGSISASISLNTDISAIGTDTSALQYVSFVSGFQNDVAVLLACNADQIVVLGISAGSIVVDFAVEPNAFGPVSATTLAGAFSSAGVSVAGSSTTDTLSLDGIVETEPVSSCTSSPCDNQATCTGTEMAYICSCVAGFVGVNCEDTSAVTEACASSPCHNSATCMLTTDDPNIPADSYNCLCLNGFANGHCNYEPLQQYESQCSILSGGNCDVDVDECISAPCLNTTTCVDSSWDPSNLSSPNGYVVVAGGGLQDNQIGWTLLDAFGSVFMTGGAGITSSCPSQCQHSDMDLHLSNSGYNGFNYGWQGATINISSCEGAVLASGLTLDLGLLQEVDVCLPATESYGYIITAGGGLQDEDIAWSLIHDGAVVAQGGAGMYDTCSSDPCEDTSWDIHMYDTYGDGWNENTLTILDCEGTALLSGITLAGQTSFGVLDMCIPPSEEGYLFSVGGGNWQNEVGWTLLDSNGAFVIDGGVGEYSTCPPPPCEFSQWQLHLYDNWGECQFWVVVG